MSIPISAQQPLTDTELDQLDEFLANCEGGGTKSVEELDGFFAALIAGPDVVMPSEYLPEVFGGNVAEMDLFDDLDQAKQILGLLIRHWNVIAATLYNQDVYLPLLLEDENGVCQGTDWAHGFMHGVHMRTESWAAMLEDESEYGWLIAVLALYHEHDEDPEMRPGPFTPEVRENLLAHMTAGLVKAYEYFHRHGQRAGSAGRAEPKRGPAKIGRNDTCPCGSGKKYKRCCGAAPIQ